MHETVLLKILGAVNNVKGFLAKKLKKSIGGLNNVQ